MNVQEKADAAIAQIAQARLSAPKHILFGSYILEKKLPALLHPFSGAKALLVTGRRSARTSGLFDLLEGILRQARIEMIPYSGIYREPTVQLIDEGVLFARSNRPDIVLAVGGGSVIDGAKAISALLTNGGSVEEYLEGTDPVRALVNAPLPLLALPTASGTGAEMTRNAVICSPEKHFKKSMRDVRMIPLSVLIDPALTRTVSPSITASGGLDTITQLVEVCISTKRTATTTALALDALPKTLSALTQACEKPENRPAREQLAYAGFVSGVCLANSGLAMAHGIAAGLGALFDVPHGTACGILLPHTLEYNREACNADLRSAMACLLDERIPDTHTVDQGIAQLHRVNRQLGMPSDLTHLYLTDDDILRLAQASIGSSMKGNPVEMNAESIYRFLKKIT